MEDMKAFEVPEAMEFNQVKEVSLKTLSHRNTSFYTNLLSGYTSVRLEIFLELD